MVRNACKIVFGRLERSDQLTDIVTGVNMILKWMLQERNVGTCTGLETKAEFANILAKHKSPINVW
jgi:hypothetical protein